MGTVITPQPSGRRYRSLRTHTTRFRNSNYPSTIRKEVQEPQDPHHQVQEQLLPLNHQEGGTGASGPTPPGSGTVITPQPSGRRYRSLRSHTTSYYPLNHQEGGTGASGPTPPGSGTVITPSTIRKEVQEPQDPHHQVITPQPSGRRYRSLRTHTTRFRNSYYPSTIRKEVQEPQDPHHQVQEQLLPLNHQEGGTGASGPTPPGSGTVITPQPSGRRYRSLRTHTTSYYPLNHREGGTGASGPTPPGSGTVITPSTIRKEVQEPQDPHHQLLPLNHQEGGTGASGPTPPGHYPSTIRKEVQEPQDPHHQVQGQLLPPQPSGRRYRSLRTHTTRFRDSYYPLNHQEGGTGASGPTPAGSGTVITPSTIRKEVQEPQDPHQQVQEQLLPLNHQEGGTGASGPTPAGPGTVITPQPSGRRYRSLRTHTTRFRDSYYPLNHQEGGTGASGPTPPGYYPSTIRKEVQEPQDPRHQVQGQLLPPQPSGRRYRSLRTHTTSYYPLNHQEGGTGASGPTPPGSGTVITPQPSGRSPRTADLHLSPKFIGQFVYDNPRINGHVLHVFQPPPRKRLSS
ncbi:uncharacterized protein [Mobula birostris]|uniref:uncharacterized protein n=1 Tax=Mobula birostris TaxID=1983395 RepID=UPI003B2826C6